jgi:hypothetical protein
MDGEGERMSQIAGRRKSISALQAVNFHRGELRLVITHQRSTSDQPEGIRMLDKQTVQLLMVLLPLFLGYGIVDDQKLDFAAGEKIQ